MIRLAVDIHGGDFGPAVTLPAAVSFLERFPDVQITLFGDTAQTHAWQALQSSLNSSRLQWQHGAHYPDHDFTLRQLVADPPPDDAFVRLLKEHAAGHSDAVVTAADTRTLLIRARQILGCWPGVRRPSLGAWIPSFTGRVLVLDVGASVDPSVADMVQLARHGNAFLHAHDYHRTPRIGLLNIGDEAFKAQARLSAVYQALDEDEALDFRGYIEPRGIFHNAVDLVVTDGFSGNIMLKSMESSVYYARHRIVELLTDKWYGRLAGLLLASLYRDDWRRLSPELQNGAPLLGVNGWVVKSHGSASIAAFEQALTRARYQVREGVPDQLRSAINPAP